MSAVNTNFDNDPFPVFTPRSSMQQQNQQQQLGRSPMQPPQQSSYSNSRFNQISQQQQQNSIGLMRSPSNQLAVSQPNLRSQFQQQQQLNNDPNVNHRQLIANMVQNMNLNGSGSQQQTPHVTKMHVPSSRTPPPPNSTASLGQHQQHSHGSSGNSLAKNMHLHMSAPPAANSMSQMHSQSSNAHRKLFPNVDASQMNSNDMVLLNGDMHQPSSQQQSANNGQFLPTDLEASRTAPTDLANIVHLKRSESYFMSEELRSEILRRNMLTMAAPSQEVAIQLPGQIKDYHNLVPLDSQQINIDHKSRTFGYQTICYKANHIKTNSVYYLKRILNLRFVNQRCAEVVETLKKIQHANICALRDVFAIVFVYDYYPGLETLQYRLYNNPNINLKGWANPYNLDGAARPFSAGKTLNGSRSLGLLPEHTVWDFVVQLSSIIRTIHTANLACRILTPSRLLIDHKTRLRLSGVGIFDVLDFENSTSMGSIAQYQQEDLIEFGRLVLALACNSLIAIQKEHINTSLDIINRTYTSDLRTVISYFMVPGMNPTSGRMKHINDVVQYIGHRFYANLDQAYTRGDVIENELSKEIENGRLFRLISKLSIVLERQDFNGDSQWGETGDRYMLKLFRDYVFHQLTPNGQPWIDVSHIVQCLNKFDAGSADKICLISPDSQNIMIVSYAQLKKCFEKVFNEITASMNT